MTKPELIAALKQADKLLTWICQQQLRNTAPGDYGNCYADLNQHGIFMSNLKHEETREYKRDLQAAIKRDAQEEADERFLATYGLFPKG